MLNLFLYNEAIISTFFIIKVFGIYLRIKKLVPFSSISIHFHIRYIWKNRFSSFHSFIRFNQFWRISNRTLSYLSIIRFNNNSKKIFKKMHWYLSFFLMFYLVLLLFFRHRPTRPTPGHIFSRLLKVTRLGLSVALGR